MSIIKQCLIGMISALVAAFVLTGVSELLIEIPKFTQGWICCAVYYLVIEYIKDYECS